MIVLIFLREAFKKTPKKCDIFWWLNLLTPLKTKCIWYICIFFTSFLQAEVTEWISSKHNMGMAFTRREWHKILSCSTKFCKVIKGGKMILWWPIFFQFDDYNWDWSLQHISHHCLQDKLQVIMAKGPRVFHIGDWWATWYLRKLDFYWQVVLYFLRFSGVHHKKSNCDSNAGLDKVKSIIKSAQKYLFPST